MTSHDAVKKMARAWKCVRAAAELITCQKAIDYLNEADKHIYDIGEHKFGKEFMEEVKIQYYDS